MPIQQWMRLLSLFVLTAALAACVAVPTAGAASGPCVVGVKNGPTCQVWRAKIDVVDDGDTVQARIWQAGRLGRRQSVRINGLQAMELHRYSRKRGRRGDCHSIEATRRLEQLVDDKKVVLMAQNASSRTTGEGGRTRLRRSIAVRRGGKLVDVGAVMLAEGHALWFPNGHEWASNAVYSRIAQQAAARGVGIWNPTACGGARASRTSGLSLKVKWNADDDDSKNINGEWVRITNESALPISLAGWWLRDSHFRGPHRGPKKGRGYMFPAGAEVPAGGSIKVHVGRGVDSPDVFYWGLDESIFENASSDSKAVGDGAYLFDPRGNLREYSMYPCRAGNCTDPLAGKVAVAARYMGAEHEWVTIRNTSAAPISLKDYELESSPWFYEFRAGTVLQPGRSVVVWISRPHLLPGRVAGVRRGFVEPATGIAPFSEAAFFESWGRSKLLADRHDVVTLRNPMGGPVACDAWGGDTCPQV